jgi:hypothetical protein
MNDKDFNGDLKALIGFIFLILFCAPMILFFMHHGAGDGRPHKTEAERAAER